ncbi:UvrD-helicase domain-containing protein [Hymenobacter psychrotolerans]|uniref:DNA 3'-5' helicase n=1 Tax=Hymenobacter psychrotolerans DSM 18569 TaxID=1121959 RepID=A0A1M6UJA2_9BACT|nr:UvrD-helicase domain-containing protein [Hymenobacter psychrotolerans]SHK69257.1 ATP-dependent exoDNAse (exonuclease V) beta subunit (contains helicase and exonuclease domains) [Hymenobacter psychrotolerans DSM 18569]
MPATFRIYSSSAGSGKTYQLTKEYLKLALGSEDPSYFKRVLAITFTNDAAGEMKQRIIGALRKFAYPKAGETDALLAEVAEELAAEGLLPRRTETAEERQQEVRRRARETFRLVLYHYADFAVSTIDSFVQRIVTVFTRELGLPATFEVELDTDAVLQTAVAALLDKVNRDPNSQLLARTLTEYALSRADEGKSWNNLPDELADFGKFLFNETVHEAVAQLQTLTLQDFRRLHETLRQRRDIMEAEVLEVAEKALAALRDADLEPSHLAGGERGVYTHFSNWKRWLQEGDTPTATALKVFETGNWASATGKKEPYASRIAAVRPALDDAFAELLALRERHLGAYLLVSAMQPYLFHASLLSELNKIVEQVSRERNIVLISEFNRRIAGIVLKEPVPFLYERLGERYNHLLIDEFQDTSVLQWNNLLPLVENSVGNDFLNLAVGDAKQAIYRWRGGEMEQILRLHQGNTGALAARATDPETRELLRERYMGLTGRLEPQVLNTNYRSAAEIVDFNNRFFSQLRAQHPDFALVQDLFEPGFQQSVPDKPQRPGHVEILFTQDEAPARRYHAAEGRYSAEPLTGYLEGATLDYDESTLYLTLALVQQALHDGYEPRDVAVLSRTRRGSRLVAKFLKERGYDIISADSLSLEFAEVVNLLVAIFRVLNQPADTLARAEALLLLDKVVRRLAPTPPRARHIAAITNAEHAADFFDEFRALGYDLQEHETGNLGLYELTERLIGLFGLLGRNGESEYLFRFLDLTLEYSLRYGNNLNNFLAYWEQRKAGLSINAPAGRNAITITTVHKAKGLAYGVVIVPFADWSLEPYRGTLLWGRLAEEDKPVAEMPAVAVVPLTKSLTRTALGKQYVEEREKTFLEGLNMLYVAFTRPRHRLYILSKRPEASKKSAEEGAEGPAKNVAALLHQYLQHQGLWDEERASFVLAEGARAEQASGNQPSTTHTFPLTNLATAPWEERLRLRRHANTVFDFDVQEKLGEWNRKLHYGLRRLVLDQDVERVTRQLAAEGFISNRERPALEQRLQRVVDNPQLARYFSEQVSVETEREILVGGVKRRDYKPDRVVFEAVAGATGRASVRVTLLDFKVPPPSPAHRLPLQQYAQLFRQLGYSQVECILYYFGTEEVIMF